MTVTNRFLRSRVNETKVLRRPRKKHDEWLNDYGVVFEAKREAFDAMVQKLKEMLQPLEGTITYREMYALAEQLAGAAVAELVTARVNRGE